MLPALLLALQTQAHPLVVEGRGRPTFAVPRVEAELSVDGELSEPAWQQAVRLTGFSQYNPADGRPAEETTEVLVFYSPQAIHFGIVAHAKDASSVRATLADRDNIGTDDRVTIYLDTFDDRRRAFIFGVNPLGVQQDGVRTEGAVSAGSIFGGSVDWNPDYLFDSKGRVTGEGYVVEVRIPFKSLRFPGRGSGPQRWGINVVRNVASSGREDTWTDARRASASFLAQSGTMTSIENVERGMVTEVQPFVTATLNGARDFTTDRYDRDEVKADAGANLRLGFPEVSLDATINPDFSQVESDVGLITVNERFALFLPEKRPFFLEGIELFSTPNQLVYTRRIVSPLGGAKLTGKIGRYSVAYLSALDERIGQDALFNVARVKADFGGNSLLGLTVTDRRIDSRHNTVVAGDLRYVFARLYYFEAQTGASWTNREGPRQAAAIWRAEFDRTGRSWGFNYLLNGIEGGFQSDAGFVPRNDYIEAHAFNRFSRYGERGALVENFTLFFGPSRIWGYDLFPRKAPIEGNELVGGYINLRGGWLVNYGVFRKQVIFDRALFTGLETTRPGGSFAPYDAPRALDNLWGDSLGVQTPVYRTFTAGAGAARQAVPIFFEGAEGLETRVNAFITLRPAPSVRVEGSAIWARIERERDGSEFAQTVIPRLKLEYQPTRALFFRAIGQWQKERRDTLRDARTGSPLYENGAPVQAIDRGPVRADWLISYEPTPGTVAFFGYGSSMEPPLGSRLSDARRVADGFFVKLAYQFRR